MFSDNQGMKLEINKRRRFGKVTNMWKLNNTLPITNEMAILMSKKPPDFKRKLLPEINRVFL